MEARLAKKGNLSAALATVKALRDMGQEVSFLGPRADLDGSGGADGGIGGADGGGGEDGDGDGGSGGAGAAQERLREVDGMVADLEGRANLTAAARFAALEECKSFLSDDEYAKKRAEIMQSI